MDTVVCGSGARGSAVVRVTSTVLVTVTVVEDEDEALSLQPMEPRALNAKAAAPPVRSLFIDCVWCSARQELARRTSCAWSNLSNACGTHRQWRMATVRRLSSFARLIHHDCGAIAL